MTVRSLFTTIFFNVSFQHDKLFFCCYMLLDIVGILLWHIAWVVYIAVYIAITHPRFGSQEFMFVLYTSCQFSESQCSMEVFSVWSPSMVLCSNADKILRQKRRVKEPHFCSMVPKEDLHTLSFLKLWGIPSIFVRMCFDPGPPSNMKFLQVLFSVTLMVAVRGIIVYCEDGSFFLLNTGARGRLSSIFLCMLVRVPVLIINSYTETVTGALPYSLVMCSTISPLAIYFLSSCFFLQYIDVFPRGYAPQFSLAVWYKYRHVVAMCIMCFDPGIFLPMPTRLTTCFKVSSFRQQGRTHGFRFLWLIDWLDSVSCVLVSSQGKVDSVAIYFVAGLLWQNVGLAIAAVAVFQIFF